MARKPVRKNRFVSLADLQKALGDAAALGYAEGMKENERTVRPTGRVLAESLLVRDSWVKKQEKSLKAAYLAGLDHANFSRNNASHSK